MTGADRSDKFKYKRLYAQIVNNIVNGNYPYNSKLPSEAEMCESLDVSRQTVRNALEQLREDGYIYSIKGSGSYVGKRINTTVKKVNVLFNSVRGYICADILAGIERVLGAHGYEIHMDLTHDHVLEERRYLQNACDEPISGLIIEGTKSNFPTPNLDIFQRLDDLNIPYVFINGYYRNLPCNAVVWNDEEVSYKLTSHLIHKGHLNIACIFRFDEMQGTQRYLGYLRALIENNIMIREELICWYSIQDDSIENPYKQGEQINNFIDQLGSRCTALVCYNDQIAGTVINRLRKQNMQTLTQTSIVSFDNSDLVKFFGLRDFYSFDHPKDKLGEAAAKLLLSLMKNNKQEPQILTVVSPDKEKELDG